MTKIIGWVIADDDEYVPVEALAKKAFGKGNIDSRTYRTRVYSSNRQRQRYGALSALRNRQSQCSGGCCIPCGKGRRYTCKLWPFGRHVGGKKRRYSCGNHALRARF